MSYREVDPEKIQKFKEEVRAMQRARQENIPCTPGELRDDSVAILFEKLTKALIEDATKAGLHNLTADQIRAIKECAQVNIN